MIGDLDGPGEGRESDIFRCDEGIALLLFLKAYSSRPEAPLLRTQEHLSVCLKKSIAGRRRSLRSWRPKNQTDRIVSDACGNDRGLKIGLLITEGSKFLRTNVIVDRAQGHESLQLPLKLGGHLPGSTIDQPLHSFPS